MPIKCSIEFSPHTRGCSAMAWLLGMQHGVFPAYAGMFRQNLSSPLVMVGFPRIRGDVPLATKACLCMLTFSPHTRGCSCATWHATPEAYVFPAYAGMFLKAFYSAPTLTCFPRIRGDVPEWLRAYGNVRSFSPHTRGCSGLGHPGFPPANVFPAYAGMFHYWQ